MKLHITETALRGLAGTGIPEAAGRAGFYSVECWGDRVFRECLATPGQDPWAQLDALAAKLPNTLLQLTVNSRGLLGHRPLARDLVWAFVKTAAAHGIGLFRVYDPLNDLKNLAVLADVCREVQVPFQGALCWAQGPVYTPERFAALARELEQMGAHSVCLLDKDGSLEPRTALELVKAVKAAVTVPVALHSAHRDGLGSMTAMMALLAGVDILDCSALGGDLPETAVLDRAAHSMGMETGLDRAALAELACGLPREDAGAKQADPRLAGREAALAAEIREVRADLGYPPMAAPVDALVRSLAAENLLSGSRYRTVSQPLLAYLHGHYGQTPGPVREELTALAAACPAPAAPVPYGLEAAARETAGLITTGEELLSCALYPGLMEPVLRAREELQRTGCRYTIEEIL